MWEAGPGVKGSADPALIQKRRVICRARDRERMQVQDKKQEWMDLQYEHIDWNDIIDAEMSGDVDALLLLR